MGRYWQILKAGFQGYGRDRAPMLAAAIAYYTVFSIAPLLIIVIAIVGLVYGSEEARSQLVSQLQQTVGSDVAGLLETMIENAGRGGSGVLATVIGIVTLLVGASGVFVQLQRALNEVWDVFPARERGVMHVVILRLRGLAMVLVLGLVLLLSFFLQAAVNIVVSNFGDWLPVPNWLLYLVNLLVTLVLFALVFAGLYKLVPDVELKWRDVWRGAILTAILLKIAEVGMGIYLGTSAVSSAYGAAGSLVVLLLWIFISAQIVLFGAEFTRADYRYRRGELSPGAEETQPA